MGSGNGEAIELVVEVRVPGTALVMGGWLALREEIREVYEGIGVAELM